MKFLKFSLFHFIQGTSLNSTVQTIVLIYLSNYKSLNITEHDFFLYLLFYSLLDRLKLDWFIGSLTIARGIHFGHYSGLMMAANNYFGFTHGGTQYA